MSLNRHQFIFLLLCSYPFSSFSQQKSLEDDDRVFKKELLYAGGSISLSFLGDRTMLGASPYLSYSVASWADVAVSMNVNYISQRNYFQNDDKVRQMIYAPGTFVRLFPLPFLYAEAHLEHNFVRQKYIYTSTYNYPDEKFNYDVNTLLVGIGYASDRNYDEDEYVFISVSMDVLKLYGSPYVSAKNNPIPIIKAGVCARLFPGSKKRKRK